jgi:hypothetical protein
LLPKFYVADVSAEIADAKRSRLSGFGFADLCSFRLAKVLFDAGMSWEIVEPILQQVWRTHHNVGPDEHCPAIFAKTLQWTI